MTDNIDQIGINAKKQQGFLMKTSAEQKIISLSSNVKICA